jgi:TolB-like protein/tetratricopeptide (TPR) repeat protein
MADLVAHCGVAERTLHKKFQTFLGVSPLRYFRQLRLAAARAKLLSGEGSVTEAALASGFSHLGRFATQYRCAFAEPPSTTARRGRTAKARKDGAAAKGREAPAPGARERPTLAILACRASASDPKCRWFAESIAEGIIAALSSVRSISALVPKSLHADKSDPVYIARELGARYVLTGLIEQAGARLRLIVRVLETASRRHVWGQSFDQQNGDVIELQDKVVAGVLAAIPPSIRGSEIEYARRVDPAELDAHGLALRALPFVFASRPDAARRALDLLNRAIEIGPDCALAASLAAWCHCQLIMYNGSRVPGEDRASALRLAQHAAALDCDDPLALTARGAVHIMARDFDGADRLLARALALDPTCAWAWSRSGWLNSYRGNADAAIEYFRRSVALDPSSPSVASSLVGIGSACFDAGRYQASAAWIRKAIRGEPALLWANRTLSVSYARIGERQMAFDALGALRRYCPDLTVNRVIEAIPFRPYYLDRLGEGLRSLGLPA